MVYNLTLSEKAFEDLAQFPKADQRFIFGKVEKELLQNPFPRGNTIKKLKGLESDIYRLRINASQSYRAFYSIQQEETVLILRVSPKKDADKIIKGFL